MNEARIGRPPLGVQFVDTLDGSPLAKTRLKVMLQTLGKELSVVEACQQLGISPSRFHALRETFLQQSLELLEPKPAGRPRATPTAEALAETELATQLDQSQRELALAEVRLELAEILRLPAGDDAEQKKTPALTRQAQVMLRRRRAQQRRRLKRLGRPR